MLCNLCAYTLLHSIFMDYFSNKVAVVTGGSEGIGKALVEKLLSMGCKVATCGRNSDKLYHLQLLHPGKPLHTVVADVSHENDCRQFIQSTLKEYGGIDIIINNAGVSMRGLFNDTKVETFQHLMNVNFWGALFCTKHALPSILERRGDVVGVSSIAGYRGLPGRSGYSASKYALQGWLEALRTELLHSGVNVMWVCPGFTASNIRYAALNAEAKAHGETSMEEGKMMSADECADHILNAIAKRKRTIVLTLQGKVTVWMNRLFASLADKMVHNFFFKDGQLVK
ncbi:MAG TPA: SDR family oxidoreductase [Phnomibacter sp.]|nr:SDR family oxidoreductase [Phnomibacter sp.]